MKYLQSLFLSVDFNSEIFLRKFIINEKEKLNLYKVIINQYIFYSNNNNSKADEENYRGDLQNLFLLLLSQMTLDKEIYHYILSPLINFINEKNILNLNKKNLYQKKKLKPKKKVKKCSKTIKIKKPNNLTV